MEWEKIKGSLDLLSRWGQSVDALKGMRGLDAIKKKWSWKQDFRVGQFWVMTCSRKYSEEWLKVTLVEEFRKWWGRIDVPLVSMDTGWSKLEKIASIFCFFYFIVLRSICVYEGSRPGGINTLEIMSWVHLIRFIHSQYSRFQPSGGCPRQPPNTR